MQHGSRLPPTDGGRRRRRDRRHAVVRPRDPAGARAALRLRRRTVLHVPRRRSAASPSSAATRCRARRTAGRPLHRDGEARPGGRMSNWMNDALGPGRHDRGDASGGPVRAARRPTSRSSPSRAGSGITPILSIIKTAPWPRRSARSPWCTRTAARTASSSPTCSNACGRRSGGRLSVHHHLDSENGLPRCRGLRRAGRGPGTGRLLRVRPGAVHGGRRGRSGTARGRPGASCSSSGSRCPATCPR